VKIRDVGITITMVKSVKKMPLSNHAAPIRFLISTLTFG